MGTFFEIFITAIITFCAGFLFLKYKPGTKHTIKQRKLVRIDTEVSRLKAGRTDKIEQNGLVTEKERLISEPGKVNVNPVQFGKNIGLRNVYRNYSPKFILIILLVMTFFSSVVYLAERGIIILKW